MMLLVFSVLLALAGSAWVVYPVVSRRLAMLGDPIPGGILDAEARKRVALSSLREVEYDRIGGKLDDEDYQRLRSQLQREALEAIEAASAAHEGESPEFVVTHSCGFANPPGSRFCSGCGAALGGRPAARAAG
jgi:cytochrome c-type biogenesis protein CcmH/NrfG